MPLFLQLINETNPRCNVLNGSAMFWVKGNTASQNETRTSLPDNIGGRADHSQKENSLFSKLFFPSETIIIFTSLYYCYNGIGFFFDYLQFEIISFTYYIICEFFKLFKNIRSIVITHGNGQLSVFDYSAKAD